MSLKTTKPSVGAAVAYNSKNNFVLPPYVFTHFPSLAHPTDSEAFVYALMRVQRELLFFSMEQVDGKLGPSTYTALLRAALPLDSEYIVRNKERIAMPYRPQYRLISFDEAGGLDLHPAGNFGRRGSPIKGVVLHWGGLNADHCFNVFMDGEREVSSHFLIGKDKIGAVCVYQILDLQHSAWHAGEVNAWTIGVDICQSPEIQWLSHYKSDISRGYNVQKIKNYSGRGPSSVLSLDPELADAVSIFLDDLFTALGLPKRIPQSHECLKDSITQFTLFGHHHCNPKKYDVACWWDSLKLNESH